MTEELGGEVFSIRLEKTESEFGAFPEAGMVKNIPTAVRADGKITWASFPQIMRMLGIGEQGKHATYDLPKAEHAISIHELCLMGIDDPHFTVDEARTHFEAEKVHDKVLWPFKEIQDALRKQVKATTTTTKKKKKEKVFHIHDQTPRFMPVLAPLPPSPPSSPDVTDVATSPLNLKKRPRTGPEIAPAPKRARMDMDLLAPLNPINVAQIEHLTSMDAHLASVLQLGDPQSLLCVDPALLNGYYNSVRSTREYRFQIGTQLMFRRKSLAPFTTSS